MSDNPISGEKVERDKKGKFLPGHNIGKIPKKRAYNVDELKKAIEEVEKGEKTTLLKHFIGKAYTSEQVLIALIKKLVPDISITELSNSGSPINVFVMQFLEKIEKKEKEINDRPDRPDRPDKLNRLEKPKTETVVNKGQNGSPPSAR